MTDAERIIINMLVLIHEENKLILTSLIRSTVAPKNQDKVREDVLGSLDELYEKIFEGINDERSREDD